MATKFHAAVPLSQEFLASPCVGASLPGDHLGVDVGLAAVDLRDPLAGRRVDPQVVVQGAVAVAGHRLGDHHPRVGVAEDAGVLFVALRVRGDLAQLEVVVRVGGVVQDDAVGRGQPLADGRERPGRLAVVEPDAGHDADALRLDEDLAFLASRRADRLAEVVVGAPEPFAVPAGRLTTPAIVAAAARPASRLGGIAAPVGDAGQSRPRPARTGRR